MSQLQAVSDSQDSVARLLFGSVPNGALPSNASESENERRRTWLQSWIIDYRFGTWEHCTYCGESAGVSDHVIPHAFYSVSKRHHGGSAFGIKTPACTECNSLLSSYLFDTMFDRCKWLNQRLWRRYKRVLRLPKWNADEIKELRHSLKTFVQLKQTERAVAMERVAWFRSGEQRSIIENAVNEAARLFPENRRLIAFLGRGFC